jgi:ATP-dependent helicase HrpA
MWAGTRRLLLLEVSSPVKGVVSKLSTRSKLTLSSNPHGGVAALLDDCVTCAVDAIMTAAGGPAWDEAGHGRLLAAVRAELPAATAEVLRSVEAVLGAATELRRDLDAADKPAWRVSVADLREQLAELVYPGFVAQTGSVQLAELPRYLTAARRRVDKLPHDAARDAERTRVVADVRGAYRELVEALPPAARSDDEIRHVRWMIEELRVSLFAQNLRTAYPISAERIYRAIDDRMP